MKTTALENLLIKAIKTRSLRKVHVRVDVGKLTNIKDSSKLLDRLEKTGKRYVTI